MSGQIAAGPVEGSTAVLERIQVSVMSSSAKGNPTQDKNPEMKDQQTISNVQRVYTSLIAGAIAGALAKTVIAPAFSSGAMKKN